MPIKKINKSLIILVTVFFIINIGLFYILLQKVDKKYSTLIEKELESFSNLQKITKESNKNFYTLSKILYQKDSLQRVNLIKERQTISDQNTKYFENIALISYLDSTSAKELTELLRLRFIFLTNCDVYLKMISTFPKDSCYSYFYNTLTQSFLNYQDKLQDFTQIHKKELLNYSDDITNNVNKSSRNILLFGLSPLILILIIALIYIVIILLAILIFRWKPIDFD